MDNQNHSCVKLKKSTPWDKLPYQVVAPHQPAEDCDHEVKCNHDKCGCDDGCNNHKDDCRRPEIALPNPVYPANATLPMLRAVAVQQRGNTVFVTASIPAEALITLPTDALEIKRISKKLKITQCRFFHSPGPLCPGYPADNAKLFIGGFVRKDIQYSKPGRRTRTTVEGEIRDFVTDIPVSGVVDLGSRICLPSLGFNNEHEYEYARRRRLGEGFPDKERLLSPDFTEFNVMTSEYLNRMPRCELIWSQINEMDEQLDRRPLCGGPFEEATFRTLQEKMVIVVQVAVTIPSLVGPSIGGGCHSDCKCPTDNDCPC